MRLCQCATSKGFVRKNFSLKLGIKALLNPQLSIVHHDLFLQLVTKCFGSTSCCCNLTLLIRTYVVKICNVLRLH